MLDANHDELKAVLLKYMPDSKEIVYHDLAEIMYEEPISKFFKLDLMGINSTPEPLITQENQPEPTEEADEQRDTDQHREESSPEIGNALSGGDRGQGIELQGTSAPSDSRGDDTPNTATDEGDIRANGGQAGSTGQQELETTTRSGTTGSVEGAEPVPTDASYGDNESTERSADVGHDEQGSVSSGDSNGLKNNLFEGVLAQIPLEDSENPSVARTYNFLADYYALQLGYDRDVNSSFTVGIDRKQVAEYIYDYLNSNNLHNEELSISALNDIIPGFGTV